MRKNQISAWLFIIVLLILLLNAGISIFNLIEDGALPLRVIPAVSWSVAVVFWIVMYLRQTKGED